MAENWNWDEMEKNAGGNFAPMAGPGFYKTAVETIDVRETTNSQGDTIYWMDFLFTEGDVRFPKISHSISFRSDSWRRVHFMRILKELGIAEDKAKQAIQNAESKNGTANIVAAYHATFDRATAKHPEIDIEVYEDNAINPNTGRPYMRTDFKNPAIRKKKKIVLDAEIPF